MTLAIPTCVESQGGSPCKDVKSVSQSKRDYIPFSLGDSNRRHVGKYLTHPVWRHLSVSVRGTQS